MSDEQTLSVEDILSANSITPVNMEGYAELIRAVLYDQPKGRWRYGMRVVLRDRDATNLAVRKVCMHWVQASREWEQVDTWRDWYRRCDEGDLQYQGQRYELVRAFDPWHESTQETTRWPEWIMRSRRRDAAKMAEMIHVRPGGAPITRVGGES